ncbi:MAG: hypothetical protein WCF21_09855 [Nitrososphaeraceae archaeon]
MTRIPLMVLIELTMAFVLLAPFLINGWMTVKAQIITVPQPENDTKLILNMKDRTQTLVNATTNETISVEKFIIPSANETTNETLPESVGNMTTNETLPESVGNMTTNETLTEKFKALQNGTS